MRFRLLGVLCVAAAALAIVAYKNRAARPALNDKPAETALQKPSVVLVADLREAGTTDKCAEIIRLVRSARDRGTPVREFGPGDESELLKRYHVLTVPTMLILDPSGRLLARFEGEDSKTVQAIRSELDSLTEVRR